MSPPPEDTAPEDTAPDNTGPDTGWDDLDIVAAEYVVGLLDQPDARALEALSFQDAAVAASIARWEDRLAPLLGSLEPVAPPPALWRRLSLAAGLESSGLELATPAPRRAGRVWRSAGLWRATTAGAAAIAASLAFLIWSAPAEHAAASQLIAALSPANTPGASFLLRVGTDGAATVTALGTGVSVPQGKSLELWAVRPGSTTPVSLGLLPAAGRGSLRIGEGARTQLLVSQEQAGGSPTHAPQGPVVYSGTLNEL